jgi:hypothetical protein
MALQERTDLKLKTIQHTGGMSTREISIFFSKTIMMNKDPVGTTQICMKSMKFRETEYQKIRDRNKEFV